MPSFTIKFYCNDEIRRATLALPEGDVLTFDGLLLKLQAMEPNLDLASHKLVWKDSDGDDVTLTSAEDLTEALRYLVPSASGDAILRLYAVHRSPRSEPNSHQASQRSPSFVEMLKERYNIEPDPAVLSTLSTKFATQYQVAEKTQNPSVCHDVYLMATQVPSTFTRGVVENQLNVRINGSLSLANPGILRAIDVDKKENVYIKLLRDPSNPPPYGLEAAISGEQNACDEIARKCAGVLGLVKCKTTKVTVHDDKQPGKIHADCTAIKMRYYPSSLADQPQYTEALICDGFRRLKQALRALHDIGLVHMDVKSANVFVDELLNWDLGDFGSTRRQGELILTHTQQFNPYHIPSKTTAIPEMDMVQLCVMIAVELGKASFQERLYAKQKRVQEHLILQSLNTIQLAQFREEVVRDFTDNFQQVIAHIRSCQDNTSSSATLVPLRISCEEPHGCCSADLILLDDWSRLSEGPKLLRRRMIKSGCAGEANSNFHSHDVTMKSRSTVQLSIGAETAGGLMTTLISRDSLLPAEVSFIFTTYDDNQLEAVLKLYQGERPLAKNNHSLCKLELSGISPAPRGIPRIKVTLQISEDGLLVVSAMDQSSGHPATRSHKIELQQFSEAAESQRQQDEVQRKAVEARLRLESYAFRLQSAIKDFDAKAEWTFGKHTAVSRKCSMAMKWLTINATAGEKEIEQQIRNLEESCGSLITKFFQDQLQLALSCELALPRAADVDAMVEAALVERLGVDFDTSNIGKRQKVADPNGGQSNVSATPMDASVNTTTVAPPTVVTTMTAESASSTLEETTANQMRELTLTSPPQPSAPIENMEQQMVNAVEQDVETVREDCQLVENNGSAVNASAEPVASGGHLYPQFQIPTPLHPNPVIASVLQQLLAMGYSNEGGRLTALVESKTGDINAVLDVLKPIARPH